MHGTHNATWTCWTSSSRAKKMRCTQHGDGSDPGERQGYAMHVEENEKTEGQDQEGQGPAHLSSGTDGDNQQG